jgi:hypothetical protein
LRSLFAKAPARAGSPTAGRTHVLRRMGRALWAARRIRFFFKRISEWFSNLIFELIFGI